MFIPLSLLPEGAKVGDWFMTELKDGQVVSLVEDSDETNKVKERIRGKMEQLRKRDNETN